MSIRASRDRQRPGRLDRRRPSAVRGGAGLGLLLAFALSTPGLAAPPGPAPAPAPEVMTLAEAAAFLRVAAGDLEAMAKRLEVPGRRIGREWRFSRVALERWLGGVDPVAIAASDIPVELEPAPVPESEDPVTGVVAIGDERLGALRGTGPEGGVDEDPAVIGYPPEGRTASEIFLRRHRVLLSPGQFILEPAFAYSHSDQREVVAIDFSNPDFTIYRSTTLEDDILTGLLNIRYGLFDETEIFIGADYRYYDSSERLDYRTGEGEIVPDEVDPRLGTESVVALRLGISRTLLHEGPRVPDVILTLEGMAPLHNSNGSITGKAWLVKSFDPVVIYGGLDYRYTWSRSYQNLNLLVAPHRGRLTGGWAFSVNDSLTLSTSVSGVFTSEAIFDNDLSDTGQVLLSSRETYSLRLGLTGMMRGGLYIEPNVTLGLSGPGNWVALGLTMPWAIGD